MQFSLALRATAVPVTAGFVEEPGHALKSAGQTIVGARLQQLESTSTWKLQLEELPQASVAVITTVWFPIGNSPPLICELVTLKFPHSSVTHGIVQ